MIIQVYYVKSKASFPSVTGLTAVFKFAGCTDHGATYLALGHSFPLMAVLTGFFIHILD
jgi:hypothetical protein